MAATFSPERFGPYLLLSHLGRGGMADVYKARMEGVAGFSRHVVVKRILRVHTEEPHFVEMFINEAKIAARLSHPNIAQVYDLGEVDGELFMAMEYIRGQDLLRVMRAAATVTPAEPAPPPPIAAFIVREIAHALGHAHDHVDETGAPRPIIHRDISPQNVMIGYDGHVKLVDFGIAKAVTAFHEVTHTGSLKGKFGYMAPEQIETGVCTAQTDIFSAGVVLHEVLTGRRLFKGQTDYDTMTKVKSAPLQPPSVLAPQVDATLDRIVMTALERDPARRYQRASQLARDLDDYLREVRFSPEDVKAWLLSVVPPAAREDAESQALAVPQGERQTTPSRSRSVSRGPSAGSLPIGSAGTPTPSALRGRPLPRIGTDPNASLGDMNGASWTAAGGEVASAPPAPTQPQRAVGLFAGGGRRPLMAALTAVAFLLSLGSVLLVLRPRPPVGGQQPPPDRLVPPAQNPGTAGNPTEGPAAQLPRPARLLLSSEPTGAMVYVGPRRLGQAPLQIDLPGDSLEVTLRYAGRPDLHYTLHRADGDNVILSLPDTEEEAAQRRRESRSRHHRDHGQKPGTDGTESVAQAQPPDPGAQQPPSTPAGPATPQPKDRAQQKGLKVKIVDDDDHGKGIKTIDD